MAGMRSARALVPALACTCLGALAACSAASPTLVEPRLVRAGDVRLQAGAGAIAPIAGDKGALAEARRTLEAPPPPDPSSPAGADDPRREGAVLPGLAVALAARPGVAPVLRATTGITRGFEGTVRYSGRDVGAGVRAMLFESRTEDAGATTLSIGLDGRALLRNRPEDGQLTGVVTDDVRGFGGAVPVVLGWQSDAGLVVGYVATTVGFDRVQGRVALTAFEDPAPARALDVARWWATGTLGLGVGFRRVRVVVELGVQRDWLRVDSEGARADVRLWSLAPAFAVMSTF